MLTTIRLYGHLGKQFGKEFNFDIETVAESIRALDANIAGFKQYLIDHSEPGYRVIVDNHPIMAVEELGLCAQPGGTIKIIPVVQGAGDGKSIGKIIVGVVLVVAAVVIAVATWGAGTPLSAAMISGAFGMGISLIAGGIMGLMSSVPTSTAGAKQSNNVGFNNGQDTIIQGLRVLIGYGTMLCEGYPISVRIVIDTDDAIGVGKGT